MMGLFVLGMAVLWLGLALWLSHIISRWLFKKITNKVSKERTLLLGFTRFFSQVSITLIILFLPFLDQLVAYPKWQQLCSTTGDVEWGMGIDESNVLGRDITVDYEYHKTTIFPNINVQYSSKDVYDSKTHELIYKKPHFSYRARALMYLPSSSGDKTAPFLRTCQDYSVMLNGIDFYRKIESK